MVYSVCVFMYLDGSTIDMILSFSSPVLTELYGLGEWRDETPLYRLNIGRNLGLLVSSTGASIY